MKTWCNYCDPAHFTIYGFCKNCRRRCEAPLYEPKGMSFAEYEVYRKRWNDEKDISTSEAIRRDEK